MPDHDPKSTAIAVLPTGPLDPTTFAAAIRDAAVARYNVLAPVTTLDSIPVDHTLVLRSH